MRTHDVRPLTRDRVKQMARDDPDWNKDYVYNNDVKLDRRYEDTVS